MNKLERERGVRLMSRDGRNVGVVVVREGGGGGRREKLRLSIKLPTSPFPFASTTFLWLPELLW